MSRKRGDSGPAWGRILFGVLMLAALTAAWHFTPLSEFITPRRVAGWARALREVWWAPLVAVFAYTPAAFVMFPRPLLTLFTVIAFGAWLGFSYTMAGILGAALATYYAGRTLPRKTLRYLAGEKLDAMTKVLRRHPFLAVLAARNVPLAPFGVEGMVAGAARISVVHYAAGTLVGMAPGVLATTVFGAQLAAALEDPSKINYWVVAGVLLVFGVLIFFVRRWFSKQGF